MTEAEYSKEQSTLKPVSLATQSWGVALLSFGLMLFELSLTRVLSVLFYHHTAFLAISLAMLGLGAGGVLVYVFPKLGNASKRLLVPLTAISMCLLPPFSPAIALKTSELVDLGGWPLLTSLFVAAVVSVLPFVFGGAFLSLLFRNNPERVGRLYGFDLLGAAMAALFLVPVMESVGGTAALFAAGCFTAISSLLVGDGRKLGAAALLITISLTFIQHHHRTFRLQVDFNQEGATTVLAEEWNAFSRVVAVAHDGWWDRGLSQKSVERYEDARPQQIDAVIDINAYAPMTKFDGDLKKVRYLKDAVNNIGYAVKSPGFEVAIIGPGGGQDVLGALVSSAGRVTAIELNPILVESFVRGRFRDFTGSIYDHKKVNVTVGEGRSELSAIERSFDVIVANSVATWAAHASGAMNLSESTIFTVEAFEEYARRLKSDGLLSISLWDEDEHSVPVRVAKTWEQALGLKENLSQHVVLIANRWQETRWFTTVLLKKEPFTTKEVDRLKRRAEQLDFDVLHVPERDDLRRLETQLGQKFELSPPTDDQPFLFYTLPIRRAFQIWNRKTLSDNTAWSSLLASLVVMFFLVVGLIAWPLFVIRQRDESTKLLKSEMLLFLALGAGFMFVEISMIQRLTLFLGHPTYALTVGLGGMLAATGCGSFLAQRFCARSPQFLSRSFGLILVFLLAAYLWLPGPSWAAQLGQSARFFVAFCVILPIGFVLGLPMAGALTIIGPKRPNVVPWAWGLNGITGVLASVITVILAIVAGFKAAHLVGLCCYVVAWMSWQRSRR